jgi:hypothetical protein
VQRFILNLRKLCARICALVRSIPLDLKIFVLKERKDISEEKKQDLNDLCSKKGKSGSF